MTMFFALLPVLTAAEEFNAKLERFPIGFWNYAPIEVFGEAKVQEWQETQPGLGLTKHPHPTSSMLR